MRFGWFVLLSLAAVWQAGCSGLILDHRGTDIAVLDRYPQRREVHAALGTPVMETPEYEVYHFRGWLRHGVRQGPDSNFMVSVMLFAGSMGLSEVVLLPDAVYQYCFPDGEAWLVVCYDREDHVTGCFETESPLPSDTEP